MEAIAIFCSAILLANVGILALNLKLYTEILKERTQQRRADGKS